MLAAKQDETATHEATLSKQNDLLVTLSLTLMASKMQAPSRDSLSVIRDLTTAADETYDGQDMAPLTSFLDIP